MAKQKKLELYKKLQIGIIKENVSNQNSEFVELKMKIKQLNRQLKEISKISANNCLYDAVIENFQQVGVQKLYFAQHVVSVIWVIPDKFL